MSIKSEARKRAQETLNAAWPTTRLPVDPIRVAQRLGLEVYTANLPGDTSGMLRKQEFEAAKVYLDTDEPYVRQRFTCAHEIGHYVRHANAADGRIAFIDYRGPRAASGTDPEEVFANEFAAALLMPEKQVRELFTDGQRELAMSQTFNVSVETAKWRLVNLQLTRA